MKKFISFFAIVIAIGISSVAFAGTNSNSESTPLVNGKEGVESQKKLTNSKYNFTLFNFFGSYSSAKMVNDSSGVKESVESTKPDDVKTGL